MTNGNTQNTQHQARKYYERADELARGASHAIVDARRAHQDVGQLEEERNYIDSIINITFVIVMTILFFGVAVAEFMISRKIYEVINKDYPWVIAAALFGVGILISHLVGYKLSKKLRSFLFYEWRLNPRNKDKINEEIEEEVKRESRKNFWIGAVLAVLLLGVITWLAYLRVQYEIEVGLRLPEQGFGPADTLPTLLYAVELWLGIYFIVFIRYMWILFQLNRTRKQFKKLVDKSATLTQGAIEYYQRAEEKDFDPFDLVVSDDLHTAFYRHEVKSVDEPDEYITPHEMKEYTFTVVLQDKAGNKVSRHVNLLTAYKVAVAGAVQKEKPYTFRIKTFPGDRVQHMFIREAADAREYTTVEAVYELNNEEPYVIIVS